MFHLILQISFKCQFYLFQQEENNNVNTQNDQNMNNTTDNRSLKYTIAAANPLLAEKLSTPSGQSPHQSATNGTSNRHQLALLTPKVEKGKLLFMFIQPKLHTVAIC